MPRRHAIVVRKGCKTQLPPPYGAKAGWRPGYDTPEHTHVHLLFTAHEEMAANSRYVMLVAAFFRQP